MNLIRLTPQNITGSNQFTAFAWFHQIERLNFKERKDRSK
jgi:hypothetical protein